MLFNSDSFILFFVIVLARYYLVPLWRVREVVLLVALDVLIMVPPVILLMARAKRFCLQDTFARSGNVN